MTDWKGRCLNQTRSIETQTILIADDHSVVRQGISQVISQIENAAIIGEAGDGLTAIALVKTHKPDLLMLDAAMPLAKGIEVLTDCRRWSPETRIILLTGFTAAGILNEWLQAGVEGILLKSCSPKIMQLAIETVLSGGRFMDEAASAILTGAPIPDELTHREREVLSLIANGYQNQIIGDRLNISSRTVEKHRASLMRKLRVTTVAELMVYALKEGLLDGYKQL